MITIRDILPSSGVFVESLRTIRDITKKIDLDVVHGGQIVDPYGYVRTGFKVTGNINRLDFDLKWNALLETGSAILGKIVSFSCDIELVRPNN